jgi:hypothetical protein
MKYVSRCCFVVRIYRVGQKLGVSLPLLIWFLRRDHPGYCNAEVGNPEGLMNYPVNASFPVNGIHVSATMNSLTVDTDK